MRVAEFLTQRAVELGIEQAFLLTGGGAMFLNDAVGHTPGLRWLCNHHEQASAMAAEGYARVAGRPALLNVTTGPGGINALNGVFGAWTDSVPMVVVSGQVKRETLSVSYDRPYRQIGDQEVDIVRMAAGITKYAAQIKDPATVRYHLDRAIHLATAGRPGPVWLDVPIDVQAALVDADALSAYDPAEDDPHLPHDELPAICDQILDRMSVAERPAWLVGYGVRASGAVELLHLAANALGIPLCAAWTGVDCVSTDSPLYGGRAGSLGDRPGNFTVQNSDCLLVIGSRLNIRQVSYNWKAFARHAWIAQVDIDALELDKPTVRPHLAVHADAREFLAVLHERLRVRRWDAARHAAWVKWVHERVARYPVVQPAQREVHGRLVNPYYAIERLFANLAADDVVVCGDGSACVIPLQVGTITGTRRLFTNAGSASMGYDLPAAIGAAVARDGRRVICLAGDGSLQLNIQELQTVVHHRLNIKLFVLNNDGYLSMKMSQRGFFGRLVGADPASGVSFPDIVKVAGAYGIRALRAEGRGFEQTMRDALGAEGPVVCEIMLDPDQQFEPKLASRALPDGRMVSSPLEDLSPFLSREELASNLFIPPYAE